MTVDVAYHEFINCNGAVVQEMAGNVCEAVPWTFRVRNQLTIGNSWLVSLTLEGNVYTLQGLGYGSSDCTGTTNVEIPYTANTTEGCFNDGGDYELFFNGAETQSHVVVSYYPVVIYHSLQQCNGQTIATVTPTCTPATWVLIRDGVTYSGTSINTIYYQHSTDINYYGDNACSGNPLYRVVTQLQGNVCIVPDVYELFVNGVKAFSFTVDE